MSRVRRVLAHLRSLRDRKGREESRRFVAEGVRGIEAALRQGRVPVELYVAREGISERGHALVRNASRQGCEIHELAAHDIVRAADSKTPQGLIATFELPSTQWNPLSSSSLRVLIADGVSDPGNLGTLVRSALAFRADRVAVVGTSADPFSPKVVRATAGAIFGIDIARLETDELLDHLDRGEFRVVATSSRGEARPERFDELARAPHVAVAVGSEHEGVSPALESRADLLVRIDHAPEVESLNAGVAGSIVLRDVDAARRSSERNRG